MKKLFAMALALMMIGMQISLPAAMAVIEADACDSGDHIWLLEETDYSGYGGRDYFNVDTCEHVPYAHSHYYITGQIKHLYACLLCEATMTETTTYRDYEMGERCVEYDPGR